MADQPESEGGEGTRDGRPGFETLEAYLAWARERGAYDFPWYKQVAPGVYELQGRRGRGEAPKRYTRQELAEMLGLKP
jgi:hypothetical protein